MKKTRFEKPCETCGATMYLPLNRLARTRSCSSDCDRARRATKMAGNQFAAGVARNRTAFRPGAAPWNKGMKGIHLSPSSEFKKGRRMDTVPIGTVKIRTRKREGYGRAFVKVANARRPSDWRERARVVWELNNGPIPRGRIVHHKNEHALDDSIGNLCLLTRAEHVKVHRDGFESVRAAAATKARWGR